MEKVKYCVVMQSCSSNTWSSDGICGIENVPVVINTRACAKVCNLNQNANSGAYWIISNLAYLQMSLRINEKVVRLDIAVCMAHLKSVSEMRSWLKAKHVH